MPYNPEEQRAKRTRLVTREAMYALDSARGIDVTDPAVRDTLVALHQLGWIRRPAGSNTRTHRNVPSIISRRQVRALIAEGWTKADIGAEIGIAADGVSRISTGMYDTVQGHTARQIDDLFTSDLATYPLSSGYLSYKAQRTAEQSGWARVRAWDGLDISDPSVHPALTVV